MMTREPDRPLTEVSRFICLLQDTDRIAAGGEALQKWGDELLALLLDHRKMLAWGGLLVPQLGDKSGQPIQFEHKDITGATAVSETSLLSAFNSFWKDIHREETIYSVATRDGAKSKPLIIAPVTLFFDKPVGYFWALAEPEDQAAISELLEYCAILASLSILSTKACSAFQLLGQPIWGGMKSLVEIGKVAADLCLSALSCRAVIIWIKTPQGRLNTIASSGLECEHLTVDLTVGEGWAGRCAQNIESYNVDDLQESPDLSAHPDLVRDKGFRSGLFLPLDVGDVEAAGVLAAYGARPRAFSVIDERIARTIANLLTTTHVQSRRMNELMDIKRKLEIEAPVIETGLLAVERVHDAKNELGFAQNSLNFIIDRLKVHKDNPSLLDARQASKHIENADKIVKALARRAKLTEFHTKRVPVKVILDNTLGGLSSQLADIKATPSLSCADDIYTNVDQEQIERVLTNIVGNSISFLSTVPRERKLRITASQRDKAVEIVVWDNGPGIAPYDLGHIFDIFFTTKGGKGMGFGLYIAKRIVEQHGGSIRASSKWGFYSEFLIRLPLSEV